MNKRYRIRTKQEFIDEYGENNWRQIGPGWNGNMDYLFGRELTDEQNKWITSGSIRMDKDSIWTINNEQVVLIVDLSDNQIEALQE